MPAVIKLIMMGLGILLMAVGVVVTPLPGPFGVPIIVVGLIILLRSSTSVKRQFVKLVKKYPRVLGPIRALLRPGAKIVALMWLNMLRCERVVLPRRARLLYRFRHRLKTLLGHRKHVNGATA